MHVDGYAELARNDLLARFAKLRAVAEAARYIWQDNGMSEMEELGSAFRALDEPDHG